MDHEYKFHKLNSNFCLWYHNPNEHGWELEDYTKLIKFNTVEEYWYYLGFLDDKIICYSMLFLMKNDIKPIWEDESNINGGYISIKLTRDKTIEQWKKLCDNFVSGNYTDEINGISITTKKNFNIIKIWFPNIIEASDYKFPENLGINDNSFIFRNHKNNLNKQSK